MTYLLSLFLIGLVLGLVGVASNPAPYFAALGLVVAAGAGCGILMGHGGPFLSLVLFLIYLGGMLVVFAYSAALAAEPYPESWGDWSVLRYVVGYGAAVVLAAGYSWSQWHEGSWVVVDGLEELGVLRGDTAGVAMVYASGGEMLMASAWVLLLTLFVVLELTRGGSQGALRAV
uniref:NADH dehydrogenase subunit 6 n=1 Tax=Malacosteus niger TaxID=76143 RepID=UPI0023AA6B08|nr:NADH dehydrogenase subunit 6 [Malacosteus niger]WCK11532.1 NADH dehydrogenase subunit 6 [Malacosteus niger]